MNPIPPTTPTAVPPTDDSDSPLRRAGLTPAGLQHRVPAALFDGLLASGPLLLALAASGFFEAQSLANPLAVAGRVALGLLVAAAMPAGYSVVLVAVAVWLNQPETACRIPAAGLIATFAWLWLYWPLASWLGGGRTPGRLIVGTRVVSYDGRPLTAWRIVWREVMGRTLLMGLVAMATCGLGCAFDALRVVLDDDGRSLHDQFGESAVIVES